MNFNDHNPPHIHAAYGDEEITFDFQNMTVIEGSLSRTALKLEKVGSNYIM